jgi:hypothetical protein
MAWASASQIQAGLRVCLYKAAGLSPPPLLPRFAEAVSQPLVSFVLFPRVDGLFTHPTNGKFHVSNKSPEGQWCCE